MNRDQRTMNLNVIGLRWCFTSVVGRMLVKLCLILPQHVRLIPSQLSHRLENLFMGAESWNKSRLGSKGVWGSIFNDNSKDGKCHKLCTYMFIDSALVE